MEGEGNRGSREMNYSRAFAFGTVVNQNTPRDTDKLLHIVLELLY